MPIQREEFTMKSRLALLAIALLTFVGTDVYAQNQNPAPRPARSRTDETLEM